KPSNLFNKGILLLLPKAEIPSPAEFRPLTVLSCIYRLIAKVVNCAVMEVADSVIPQQQKAFMKGRDIMDHVRSLHNWINSNKKRLAAVLLIDFNKAYDSVDRNTIINILIAMNAPSWLTNFTKNSLQKRTLNIPQLNTDISVNQGVA